MLRFAISFGGCVLASVAHGDNAALTAGGQPRMMSHHPQVRMASEVVHLVVSKDKVKTDCTFVFKNEGKACKVRMGFPDFGLWAYAYPRDKAQTRFKSYQSFVDGKSVQTKLILGSKPGEQWRVKEVIFPAKTSVTVREVYTTEVGGISDRVPIGTAAYLVHTGASWKGPIGSALIDLQFEADNELPVPLQISTDRTILNGQHGLGEQITKPGGLLVLGPSIPTVSGRKLTFSLKNWTPTKKDDLYVFYRYPPKALEEQRKKAKG